MCELKDIDPKIFKVMIEDNADEGQLSQESEVVQYRMKNLQVQIVQICKCCSWTSSTDIICLR